jgi:hypothetical protein
MVRYCVLHIMGKFFSGEMLCQVVSGQAVSGRENNDQRRKTTVHESKTAHTAVIS